MSGKQKPGNQKSQCKYAKLFSYILLNILAILKVKVNVLVLSQIVFLVFY